MFFLKSEFRYFCIAKMPCNPNITDDVNPKSVKTSNDRNSKINKTLKYTTIK